MSATRAHVRRSAAVRTPVPTPTPIAQRIAWWALLSIPVAIPLATSNFTALTGSAYAGTYDVFSVPKLLMLGLLLAVGLGAWAVGVISGDVSLRSVPGWPYAAAFLGLASLSTAFAVHPQTALFGSTEYKQGLLTLYALAAVGFLAVQLVRSPAHARALAQSAVLGGALVALWALGQVFGLDPSQWGDLPEWLRMRGFASLGNSDMLGGYLLFPLALAPALALSEPRVWLRVTNWVFTALAAAALVASMTRGAWIGGAVAIAVLVFALVRSQARPTRVDAIAGSTALVALLLAVVSQAGQIPRLVERITSATSGGASAGSGRLYLWRSALEMIGNRPLTGTGPDSFRLGWYQARSLAEVSYAGFQSVAEDAHNYPLMLASTLGVPAALAAVALVVAVLWLSRGVFAREAATDRLPLAGWWSALIGFSVFLLLGVNVIGTAVMLWLALGVLSATRARSIEAAVPARVVSGIAAAALGLAVLWVGAIWTSADASMMRTVSDPQNAAVHAQTASERAPWSYAYRARLAELLGDNAKVAAGAGDRVAAEGAVAAYQSLIDWAPGEYDTYVKFSALLNALSQTYGTQVAEQAAQVAERGIEVQPNGLSARVQAAVALFNLERYEDVVGVLGDYWDVDRRVSQPGELYAEALIMLDDRQQAALVLADLEERHGKSKELKQLEALLRSEGASETPTP